MAGFQWAVLKLDVAIALPARLGNTSPAGPGSAQWASCSASMSARKPGIVTRAPPGAGLGRPPGELAFHLDELLEDGDRPAGDVDPGPLEADQLAPPQSGLGRGVDQHPEVRVHLLGQPVHLGGGEEAHLDRLDRRGLDPGAR